MDQSEFIVVLKSTFCTDIFPSNNSAHFTNLLHFPINGQDNQYECAVVDFDLNSPPDVHPLGDEPSKLFFDTERQQDVIAVYQLEKHRPVFEEKKTTIALFRHDIVKYFRENRLPIDILEKLGGEGPPRFVLHINYKGYRVSFSPLLQKLFGFTDDYYSGPDTYVAEKPYDSNLYETQDLSDKAYITVERWKPITLKLRQLEEPEFDEVLLVIGKTLRDNNFDVGITTDGRTVTVNIYKEGIHFKLSPFLNNYIGKDSNFVFKESTTFSVPVDFRDKSEAETSEQPPELTTPTVPESTTQIQAEVDSSTGKGNQVNTIANTQTTEAKSESKSEENNVLPTETITDSNNVKTGIDESTENTLTKPQTEETPPIETSTTENSPEQALTTTENVPEEKPSSSQDGNGKIITTTEPNPTTNKGNDNSVPSGSADNKRTHTSSFPTSTTTPTARGRDRTTNQVSPRKRPRPDGNQIYLISDVIENQAVGNLCLPLLKLLYPTRSINNYSKPIYLPIKNYIHRTITISLLTESLENVPVSNHPTTVTLHFRRRA